MAFDTSYAFSREAGRPRRVAPPVSKRPLDRHVEPPPLVSLVESALDRAQIGTHIATLEPAIAVSISVRELVTVVRSPNLVEKHVGVFAGLVYEDTQNTECHG